MRRLALLTLFGVAILNSQSVANTARGVVYHDANANGARDRDEEPIAGVCVSNGLEVVKTGEDGRYELPVDDDTAIFVIKPRGWMTAIDDLNIPRHYYTHKPKGSPPHNYYYPGIDPTGPLPNSIDFPLTRTDAEDDYSVIMMGDPQPYDLAEIRYYANDIVSEIHGSEAKFMIALGDLVGDDLSLFEPLNEVHAALGIPIYNVYGNHDMNFRSPNDEDADETFERVYGPPNYAFQYGQTHFIVLDNVRWNGFQRDNVDGRPNNANYNGHLHEHQLEFVKNYVALVPKGDRIVICTHIPLPLTSFGGETHSTPQYAKLLEILSGHPYTCSFSGHTHINQHFFAGAEEGYDPGSGEIHHHHNVVTASGSWYRGPLDDRGHPMATMRDGAPNGYAVYRFSGNKHTGYYRAAGRAKDYQLEIYAPPVVTAGGETPVEIQTNVFNGSEKSTVKLRLGDGEWQNMEKKDRLDPAYAALYKRDKGVALLEKRSVLPEPAISLHMWQTELPSGLDPGFHLIEVETTDVFGQTYRAKRIIEVR